MKSGRPAQKRPSYLVAQRGGLLSGGDHVVVTVFKDRDAALQWWGVLVRAGRGIEVAVDYGKGKAVIR